MIKIKFKKGMNMIEAIKSVSESIDDKTYKDLHDDKDLWIIEPDEDGFIWISWEPEES